MLLLNENTTLCVFKLQVLNVSANLFMYFCHSTRKAVILRALNIKVEVHLAIWILFCD